MSVAVKINKVMKKFGDDTVLKGLSLDIKPGELFTLLGPSGCGKTTLLRMIIGFNSIDDGKIELDNKIINEIPVNKRNMGMVFQNYAIFPHMTVKENIAFGLKSNKENSKSMEKKIEDILKVVKIEQHKDKKPDKLSGGQQQRVALARALVIHPKVLLMDEPLSNLDAKLRIEMRNAIRQIQQKVGITTVYVTHDQEEALAISDRIAVMYNGVIQQIGKPEEIYKRPNNLFVAQFIGTSNPINGIIKKDEGSQTLIIDDSYYLKVDNLVDNLENNHEVITSIRPQDFVITKENNSLRGIIKSSMFLGLNTHYFVELSNGNEVEVIEDAESKEVLPEGTPVKLKLKANNINIFDRISETTLLEAGV